MSRWVGAKMEGILIAAGTSQLALGIWMAAWPASFFRVIGGFGLKNAHYVRDVSTIYLALATTLLLSATRPGWRRPVLLVCAIQYAAHSVNHLVDAGAADPSWIGPFDLVLIAGTAVLFFYLFLVSNEGTKEGPP